MNHPDQLSNPGSYQNTLQLKPTLQFIYNFNPPLDFGEELTMFLQ